MVGGIEGPRNPYYPLLHFGTRSPDPSRDWDRMWPPTTAPNGSSSGLFPTQLGRAKPPISVWEVEKEGKAQGNFSLSQGFLRASPWWSLRKPRSAQASRRKLVLSETEAGLRWVDRKVLLPLPPAGAPMLSTTLAEGPPSANLPAQSTA